MQWSLGSRVKVNDGVEIPRLGLGVYRSKPGRETRGAVECALEIGYRHVDTARIYENEADVGAAIRASGIPRGDLFVTTKLWNADHGRKKALRACDASLEKLGLEYVDLYLVHWPVRGLRGETWEALIALHEEGKARAIGVSNYMLRHLDELLRGSRVIPAVNQVECSPFLIQAELRAFCAARGIVVEAYSPLTKGRRLHHPRLVEIARRNGRTPAQVLIRWALQHDLVALPKSVRPERIRENAQVFDFHLSAGDMQLLDSLDEGLHTGWDPTGAP